MPFDPFAGPGGHKRRGDDAARAAQRLDATLQGKTTHAGFVAKPDLARRLFANTVHQLADLCGCVADGKPRDCFLSRVMHCHHVFFLVGEPGRRCCTINRRGAGCLIAVPMDGSETRTMTQ